MVNAGNSKRFVTQPDPRVSPDSSASVDPVVVEIGHVRLSQIDVDAKTRLCTHKTDCWQIDRHRLYSTKSEVCRSLSRAGVVHLSRASRVLNSLPHAKRDFEGSCSRSLTTVFMRQVVPT